MANLMETEKQNIWRQAWVKIMHSLVLNAILLLILTLFFLDFRAILLYF